MPLHLNFRFYRSNSAAFDALNLGVLRPIPISCVKWSGKIDRNRILDQARDAVCSISFASTAVSLTDRLPTATWRFTLWYAIYGLPMKIRKNLTENSSTEGG